MDFSDPRFLSGLALFLVIIKEFIERMPTRANGPVFLILEGLIALVESMLPKHPKHPGEPRFPDRSIRRP